MSQTQEVETADVPIETLEQMAFSIAPEVLENDDVMLALPEGAEDEDIPPVYELQDDYTFHETVTDDKRGWGIVFGGPVEVGVSYRTARATRWQPAEYDTEWHDMGFVLEFYPGDNDGFGSARFEVDY